jgi:hypothetical protein
MLSALVSPGVSKSGAELSYSIVGGADQAKFAITGVGVLSFQAAPDYEAPTDANGDNLYVLIVQASDGSFTSLQAILVTVTNVSEPPPLLGDYTRDGTVDAADYVMWRKTLGTSALPAYSWADGDGDTTIDNDDYGVWQENFGESLAGAGSGDSASGIRGLRSLSFDAAEMVLTTSNSWITVVHEPTARALHYVTLEPSFRRLDATARLLRRPNTTYRFAESRTDELLLLAIDRISGNMRQDFVLRDIYAHEQRDDDIEGRIDEARAAALAEWY